MAERRRPQLRNFVRALWLIVALFFVPSGIALWLLPTTIAGHRIGPLVAVALISFTLAGIGPRVRAGFQDVPRAPWIGAIAWPLFDSIWCGLLLAPATMLLTVPFALVVPVLRSPIAILQVGLVIGIAAGFYGALIRRHWVRARRVEVFIEGLPKAFDGFRIAHLSDLHVGTSTRAAAAMRWVRHANALGADLVAVTGDVLTTGTAFHDEVVEVLGALRGREGVAFCLGNHDYYEEATLCGRLARAGLFVLRNQGFLLRRGDDALWVAGVEDPWRGEVDLHAALADAPAGTKTVLLAHNPKLFPLAVAADVALTLSGHTHAGQVAMPFLVERMNLALFTEKRAAGYYREGESHLFVHAGLGTTGPGMRLGAAPEIVEIVLRAR